MLDDGTEQVLPSYAIITPARNEAQFIEQTIHCMIAQTVQPVRWLIVSDGSTDGTDEIVHRYTGDYSWIQLLRMPERAERDFAGKANAFNAGYAEVKSLAPDIIGNLDADLSFGPSHFELLLDRFRVDSNLGVAGSPYTEGNEHYDFRFSNIEHVSGACQMFRRECFESIGGYQPLKMGCIDYVAVTTARMAGWSTRTFTDTVCIHHRSIGTAQQSVLKARFSQGKKDYVVGNHLLWEALRVMYQMRKKPRLTGGLALAAGFLFSQIHRSQRAVSPELVAFVHREQMTRLKRLLRPSMLQKVDSDKP